MPGDLPEAMDFKASRHSGFVSLPSHDFCSSGLRDAESSHERNESIPTEESVLRFELYRSL